MGGTIKYVLTDRCNGACSYCFIRGRLPHGSMSPQDVVKSFDVLWPAFENHFDCVHFFGGEPTLRMDLVELATEIALERCRATGLKAPTVFISTNCLELSDRLLHFLVNHRERVLLITSADGPADIHDHGRGAGSYSRVAANAARLRSEGIQIFNVTAVYGQPAYRAGLSPYQIAEQLVAELAPVSITFNLLHTNQAKESLEPDVFYKQLFRGYRAALQDLRSTDQRRRAVAEAFLHIDLARMGVQRPYYCDFGISSIAVFPGGLVDVCSDVPLFGMTPQACVHDPEFPRRLSQLRAEAEQRNWKSSGAVCRRCFAAGSCHLCPFWPPQRRAAHCQFLRRKHALLTGAAEGGDEFAATWNA